MNLNDLIMLLVLSFTSLGFSSLSLAECNLNSTSALPLQVATSITEPTETRKILLNHNRLLSTEVSHGQLELRDADSLILFDQLSAWSDTDTDIDAAIIMAEPALLDQDANGLADAVYVVDISGRVWFIALSASGFASPVLIADFSAIDATFTQPLQLVQTTYRVNYSGVGDFQRMKVSLVLIASHDELGDTVLLFNHQPQLSRLINFSDLMDRTDLGDDDSDVALTDAVWRDLQQSPGWLIQLDASVMLKPQVYAGVVYFVTADTNSERTDCNISAEEETRLFAVHLHHAGKVYARRSWRIDAIANAALQLNAHDDKLQLNLVNDTEHSEVIPEMLAITEHCADCSEALKAADFPRSLRLATYVAEYGAW